MSAQNSKNERSDKPQGLLAALRRELDCEGRRPTAAAVLTSFNKIKDVRINLTAIFNQTVPFERVIVVDNCSKDGTIAMVREEFPQALLIVMPTPAYGACETFNIGFKNAATDFIAILDDDVEMGPEWLEMMLAKFETEPPTTACLSSRVVEPGMPQWFKDHPEVRRERFMSTFRGCATLARTDVLEACGYYADDFFIYGNERDLTARILKAGYRVLQFPDVVVKHGTPFGMKTGGRSLFFHTRNLWWTLFKHAPLWQIIEFLVDQVGNPARHKTVTADAVGTIGFGKSISETKGGWWILTKSCLAAFAGLPACLRVRKVCRAVDFNLPSK